jgi:transmembrane sensor
MATPGRGTRSDEAVRRESADWVAQFHDPDTEVDREAFERWRDADPRHAEVYARVEQGWERSALLTQTRFGRARRLPERRRGWFGPRTRYAFAAAAVLIVAVAGLALASPDFSERVTRPGATEFASQVGEIRELTLADGSSVTLDTDSALRMAFTPDERRLILSRGRAPFEVAHDAARPFVVVAGGGSIVALSSVFDVDIADERVRVILLRGTVEVRKTDVKSNAVLTQTVRRLQPNQTIVFVASAPLLSPQPAVEAEQRWASGMLAFDETRLADAVAEANRYSTGKIVIADPAVGELRITGAYRAGDIPGFARSVADSLGLRLTKAQDDLVLTALPERSVS